MRTIRQKIRQQKTEDNVATRKRRRRRRPYLFFTVLRSKYVRVNPTNIMCRYVTVQKTGQSQAQPAELF